jgi:hypothetical protein
VKLLKITLYVLVGIGISVALVVGGIRIWLARNMDALKRDGVVSWREGQELAAGHDQNACINEALKREKERCGVVDLQCEVQAGVFLRACLKSAAPVEGLCTAVPPPGEILRTLSWETDVCRAVGATVDRCGRLMQNLQAFCHGK